MIARGEHIASLTGLRGAAACAVMLFHLWPYLGSPLLYLGPSVGGYPLHALAAVGYLGVDLFFVLSAFLLAIPFFRWANNQGPWPSLRRFFVHRAKRVIPAFWAQILILVVIGWWYASEAPFSVRTAFLHAFFLQHLAHDPGKINPVYWSLPVEWWFYFCLPLMAFAFAHARWWILLALALATAIAFRLQCHEWLWKGSQEIGFNYAVIMFMRARLDEFFLGMLAAWFYVRHAGLVSERLKSAIGVFSLMALLALAPWLASRGDIFVKVDYPWLIVHYAVVGLLMSSLVYASTGHAKWLNVLLANKLAKWLGDISYSIYLWHIPVLAALQFFGAFEAHRALGGVLAVFCVIAASAASYYAIELPFLRSWRGAEASALRAEQANASASG